LPNSKSQGNKDLAEESRIEALLKIIMEMQGRLEKAESTVESLTLDRNQLQMQVHQLCAQLSGGMMPRCGVMMPSVEQPGAEEQGDVNIVDYQWGEQCDNYLWDQHCGNVLGEWIR